MDISQPQEGAAMPARTRRLHPVPVRIMHWLNALAMLVLIGSGWAIYNAQPVLPAIRFPESLTMGGDPEIAFRLNGDGGFGGALQWHFAAMWLLVLNGLAYLGYGIATGRFRQKFFPIRPREVVEEIARALRFDLSHADITLYNAVQKLLYVGVILVIVLQVAAGLVLWKPVQFSNLTWLMGGFQGVRMVHFLGMAAIVGFLCVHVLLALIVPRTIVAMVTGGPHIPDDGAAAGAAGDIAVASQGHLS